MAQTLTKPIRVEIPAKIMRVFSNPDGTYRPSFFKVLHGGRGSGKSESIARILIAEARSRKQRILCTRQFQNSILDSVHKTITDAAEAMGVLHEFEVTQTSITHRVTGADFVFKGLQRSIGEIKSMKGVRRCWVEEAATVPKESWQVLEPTIREEGGEIWVSYNPDQEEDATHQKFVIKPTKQAIVAEVNWRDNPWFPKVLDMQRLAALEEDPDAYDWIWEGHCRKVTEAIIFRNRVVTTLDFDEPPNMRPFYGLDFGFANDPNAGVRCYSAPYLDGYALYVTHEAYGLHVELDDTPAFLRGELNLGQGLPGVEDWPLKCDSSQPGMISYLTRHGMNASGAEKWPGSVEDGVRYLKAFKKIFIHPRCKNLIRESRLYSYKVDKRQLDGAGNPSVLPIIVDRHNHGFDALRYALDGHIERGGDGLGVWAKLAREM